MLFIGLLITPRVISFASHKDSILLIEIEIHESIVVFRHYLNDDVFIYDL